MAEDKDDNIEADLNNILAELEAIPTPPPPPPPPTTVATLSPSTTSLTASSIIEDAFKICDICYEIIQQDSQYHKTCPYGQYCKTCVGQYVNTQIFSARIRTIRCPCESCENEIDDAQVRMLAEEEALERYEYLLMRAWMHADPAIRWCPHCEYIYFVGEKQKSEVPCRVECPQCQKDFCYGCNRPWHQGMTCAQAANGKYKVQEKEYKRYANKHTKNCPSCKSPIEKSSGCNHMTCSRCGYQFCWLCGGKYSGNHYASGNVFGCPGLQYARSRPSWGRRVAVRTAMGVGYAVGVPLGVAGAAGLAGIAAPLLVVAGPIYLGVRMYRRKKRQQVAEDIIDMESTEEVPVDFHDLVEVEGIE